MTKAFQMTKQQRRQTLQRSARRFFLSLLGQWESKPNKRKTRQIYVESLENRELMAADYEYSNTLVASPTPVYSSAVSSIVASPMSTSNLVAEGENAPDLVAFAKALTQAGVRFFGADWCPFCNEQKKLFEDGYVYLPFIEVTNADRTLNSTGTSENITTYPTWEFSNGQRVTGVQTLAQLSSLSGVAIPQSSQPSFVEIANQTVLNTSPLHIPVDAYDPNGNPLTITVTSSNPSVIAAEMINNPKSARVTVNGYGEMVFRLFDDEASRPVDRFETLANSGFYNQTASNKIIFHRVIDNFVIQAGDPTGTGSGGSSLGDFDDQFNVNLQHNRTGVLSYAKSSDDTNDSQFFITEGSQRHLDFNHSVFGQLIEGESKREGISRTSVSNSRPTNEVSINSVQIFDDFENGLIRLKALATSGTSTITVTATDSTGLSFTRTFVATAAADTANGGPFLNEISVPPIQPGQTVSIQLTSQDAEGDAVTYDATKIGTGNHSVSVNSTTGLVSVTAPTGFTGTFQVSVGVRPATTSTTADQFDTEVLTFNVASALTAPTSVDLVNTTDTGVSDSDNITSAGTMQFLVSGTTVGATVNLKVGTQVVGTATATGSTTTISTNLVAQLGAGTRSIVASQTQNGTTSADSPALSVTFDATAPTALPASALPTQANVGTQLSVDLGHSEEGSGLRYSLDNAPTGMSINQTTGVLTWTPTSGQIGPHAPTLRLTDAAGNSVTQVFAMTVADSAKVSVSLELLNATTGAPLTSASIGQEFTLRVTLRDLRTAGSAAGDGVFSAYMDIVYDADKVEVVGTSPITYGNLFGNGQTGTTTTAGLIDELGAFSSLTAGPGRAPQTLADIRMRVKAAGQVNFSTNPGENSSRGFTIFKEDTQIPTTLVTFGTAALPVAQNFTAIGDSFSFNEDTTNNSLTVLANDTIVPGTNTVLSIQSVSTPSQGGTVSIASDNQRLVYNPAANFNGTETFTYTVRDQNGASATATVTVQVQSVNDNPVAVNDTITTVRSGDTDVFINVLSNDTSGPDTGETLTVSAIGTGSQGGSVRIGTAGNGVIYTPKAGFVGTETFTYTLSDGRGGTATGTVTVTVGPAVPPPVVQNDAFPAVEDAVSANFNPLTNDTPSQAGETLTIIDVKAPTGTASVAANGTLVAYAPAANFNGTELVVYTVRSTNGGTAKGTITFTVSAVNDAPDAVNDSLSVLSNSAQTVNVLANDTNVDSGEVLTITAVTQPSTGNGTVAISTDKKSIIYTAPTTQFTGTVSFTYTISDGNGLTDTATATLNVQNYTPRDVGIATILPVSGVPIEARYVGAGDTGGLLFQGQLNLLTTDSGAKVTNASPGIYEFSIPDLPFLTGGEQRITVNSAFSDTSSIMTVAPSVNRDARYIDLRDFSGKNLRRGMTTAVAANSTASWYDGQGDWKNFKNIQVSLNSAGTSLTINATNPTNQNVRATLPVTDSRVSLRGKEGTASLFRIQAAPNEVGFSAVTTTASTNSTTTASGEGEGEGPSTPVNTVATPLATTNTSNVASAASSSNSTSSKTSNVSQSSASNVVATSNSSSSNNATSSSSMTSTTAATNASSLSTVWGFSSFFKNLRRGLRG